MVSRRWPLRRRRAAVPVRAWQRGSRRGYQRRETRRGPVLHTGQNFGGPKHGPVPKARTLPPVRCAWGWSLPLATRRSAELHAMGHGSRRRHDLFRASRRSAAGGPRRVDPSRGWPPEVSSSSIRVNPAVPATMEAGASSRSADVVTMEATSAVCPPQW